MSEKLNVSVKEVLKLLESSKAKERQDGLAGLRRIFKVCGSDTVFEWLLLTCMCRVTGRSSS